MSAGVKYIKQNNLILLMKKRGYSTIEIIGMILVVLVVAVIIIVVFRNYITKQAEGIEQEIELGFGDQDRDSVADKFDACLCVPGEFGNDGCPYDVQPKMSNQTLRFKDCSEAFCQKLGLDSCPK